jgi:hypothetical protein
LLNYRFNAPGAGRRVGSHRRPNVYHVVVRRYAGNNRPYGSESDYERLIKKTATRRTRNISKVTELPQKKVWLQSEGDSTLCIKLLDGWSHLACTEIQGTNETINNKLKRL